jgi:predicted SAM-dependent methyltransferase
VVRRFAPPYRLHLGCGRVCHAGWINIDREYRRDSVDLAWDLRKPLPFRAGSCSFVYSEHLIEHLSPSDGIALLRECHRVLQSDGTMRIATPSLRHLVEDYCSENWRQQDWLKWESFAFVETPAEMLNIAFRWWGHRWLYDREELVRRILEAGFSAAVEVDRGASEHAPLRGLETREDSKLVCEATKAEVKPRATAV